MKPDIKTTEGADSSPLEKALDQDVIDVPDFRFIYVTLTFDGFIPFKFKFKRQQSKEVKAQRQQFYDLPDEMQKDQSFAYRASILSQILLETPQNIPNWPLMEGEALEAVAYSYFTDENNEELVQWIWSQYQEKLYPKELLSSPLE